MVPRRTASDWEGRGSLGGTGPGTAGRVDGLRDLDSERRTLRNPGSGQVSSANAISALAQMKYRSSDFGTENPTASGVFGLDR